ncbi:MAG: hypothetical protein L6R38_004855 [Xanthoria sp. 2 TBL-2021]|nr:MAG: hypothetical protein L6R38_004855 [Xanthoria sp. 2 TBL-2021]
MARNLYRHPRIRNQLGTQELDANMTQFLELCTARDTEPIIQESRAYLSHLKYLARGKWTGELDKLVHAEYLLRSEPFEKIIQLGSEVASVIREHGGISINKIVQKLQQKKVLCEDDKLSQDPFAQSLIFCSLGWLSLLYIPAKRTRSMDLRITIQSTKSAIRSNVAAEMAARPLDELLRSFGELLPKKVGGTVSNGQTYAQEPTSSIKFQVSHLNVATLQDIATMEIVWVDSLSAHLEFDPTIPSISLFKCPSFCKIHQSPDSILAL